jgi:dolichyl-phosphate beta-glucosyltransferase
VRSYFDQALPLKYEVIVVDDGSDDDTGRLVREHASAWPELRSITYRRNAGKGSAMRTGALNAAGKVLLFTDADGATPIEYEAELREAIDRGADVATGVRCRSNGIQRRPVRRVVGSAFHAASRFLLGTAH